MKKVISIFIIIPVIFLSCSSLKKGLELNNDENEPIEVAIQDFTKSSKLFKKDSVFSVELLGLINNKEVIVVRIGRNVTKLLLTKDATVGSLGKLPSRFIEKDGKLFFWWDDEYALTENTLTVLKKYHLLQDDQNGSIKVPDNIIFNDSQKAVHYYFCKGDYTNFKKVTTNKGIGYYEIPLLNCHNDSQNNEGNK